MKVTGKGEMTMKLVLVFLGVLLATPAWAQQIRTIVQVPVNFRNDKSQPRTLAQLKADGDALMTRMFGPHNTYGAVTWTTKVLNYVTVDMDKGCNLPGATLPALNMTEFFQKLDAALTARGESRFGYTYSYIVSPTTFVKCSHTNRYGFAFDSPLSVEEAASNLAWQGLGLGLSVNWLCRQAAGSSIFVTLSAFCGLSPSSAGGRDFTAITGQGGGSVTGNDRDRLGWLPAWQQETVTATSGQWTLTYLENPAEGLKRLLIPAMGVELSYHAPKTSIGWDTRGVTAHVINSSRRLDFTPDDRWLFGTTALAPGAPPWIYNNLKLTVLLADLNVVVVDLRPASDPVPPPPPPPQGGGSLPACVVDGATRVLSQSFAVSGLTPQRCNDRVKLAGLPLFGLENGNECYGGNALPPVPTDPTKPGAIRPMTECAKPCAGDRSVSCGGGWRVLVNAVK